jgi:hypothetical protein
MKKIFVCVIIYIVVLFGFYFFLKRSDKRSEEAGKKLMEEIETGGLVRHEDGVPISVELSILDITGVRSYEDHPDWCIIMTIYGEFVVEENKRNVWDEIGEKAKKGDHSPKIYKILFNNIDPHKPKEQ